MSSIRIPPALLAELHEAAPPGVSLPALIRWLLQRSGGPGMVRGALRSTRSREAARAQVARLKRHGHRSVILRPEEQLALAEASAEWVGMLKRQGARRFDPATRTLHLEKTALGGSTGTKKKMRLVRTGVQDG